MVKRRLMEDEAQAKILQLLDVISVEVTGLCTVRPGLGGKPNAAMSTRREVPSMTFCSIIPLRTFSTSHSHSSSLAIRLTFSDGKFALE
jgi:hypothetical protein